MATSIDGILQNPKFVREGERAWMTLAPEKPWTGIFSKPDIGIDSGMNYCLGKPFQKDNLIEVIENHLT